MNPAITSESVITIPSLVIIIIISRNRVLYIRSPNTIHRNIYRKNKKLKKLNLEIEISISLDPEIPITLINALVVLIYSILLKLKVKKVIKIVKTN